MNILRKAFNAVNFPRSAAFISTAATYTTAGYESYGLAVYFGLATLGILHTYNGQIGQLYRDIPDLKQRLQPEELVY